MPDQLRYSDLGATLYPSHVPAGLVDELPGLYSSLYSTSEWFETQDGVAPQGACTLSDPRHVLLFTVEDGTIEILNKAFRMAPADADRACRAIFRAFPHVHRLHLEVMFPPREMSLPNRMLYELDHAVLDLPDTVDEYRASLSKSLRKSLKYRQRRLQRDFDDISTEIVSPGTRSRELFDLYAKWKASRFEAHGRPVFLAGEKLVRLLELRGEAHVTSIQGQEKALMLGFTVGSTCYGKQIAFAPELEPYALGTLATYWSICSAIERGMNRFDCGWGMEHHKERFGARPVRATRLSVFPSQVHRLQSIGEARDVLVDDIRRRSTRLYWRTRHSTGKAVRARLPRGTTVRRSQKASETSHSQSTCRRPIRYPDLGATIHPQVDPSVFSEELDTLYSSLLSTIEWFEIEDGVTPTGACILERPRHILFFYHDKNTIEILNKEFSIAPADATRACRALFRAFPRSCRIHLEVKFPPTELRLPKRVLYWADHMVIDLPPTPEAYTASLGKRTRRHLRHDQRRLERNHTDITIETVSPTAEAEELVATFVSWKNSRFNATGRTTIWQDKPGSRGRLTELVRRRGQARVMSIDGDPATIHFLFPVGRSVYVLQSGFDPQYLPYGLGLLGTYAVACEAAAHGYPRLSLLWGADEKKKHLGARPHRAVRLSVFRSTIARIHSLDEAREVALRNLTRNGQRDYWRARHAARRAVDATIAWKQRRPQSREGAE